jgi:hypothetical protein
MLLDPSKLRLVGIHSIWAHWAKRQKENTQGLIFLKAQDGDMREKAAVAKGKKGDKDYHEIDDPQRSKDKGAGSMGDQGEGGGGGNEKDPDNGQGSSSDGEPHPDSPAAHFTEWGMGRVKFMRTLSEDPIFLRFVDEWILKMGVSTSLLCWQSIREFMDIRQTILHLLKTFPLGPTGS